MSWPRVAPRRDIELEQADGIVDSSRERGDAAIPKPRHPQMKNWRAPVVRQMTLLPLLFLLLGGMAAGGGARVLCVGEDGHVELELATFGECCASELPSLGQMTELSPDLAACEGGCGECRDLPLEPHALGARRPDSDAPAIDLDLPIVCLDLRGADVSSRGAALRHTRPSALPDLRPNLPILRI